MQVITTCVALAFLLFTYYTYSQFFAAYMCQYAYQQTINTYWQTYEDSEVIHLPMEFMFRLWGLNSA
jgi:hypothetical protein